MRLHVSLPAAGFFICGALTLIAQLLCLQELLILFAGHELFLGFSLAAWMAWVGAGSWAARRIAVTRLPLLAASSIPLLILNVLAIRLAKGLFGFGMLAGLLPMLLLTAVLLAPVALLTGASFSLGCAWASQRDARFSVGAAYAWETLGAAFGGLLYTGCIAGRLAPEWALALLALPAALLAAGLLPRRRSITAAIILALAVGCVLSPLPRLTRQLQWRGYTLQAERYSRYGHLVLANTGRLTSLFTDGMISAHFPDPAAYEELVHWPLLSHPAPRRVLILGGAATGSLAEILKHPVERVDYVELDPAVIQLVESAVPPADRAALQDPRVRLLHLDGRRWLAQTAERYDVILLALPPPSNAQINRLYTLEAFRAVRARLASGGLFAFTIPSSENYLSPDTAYFNACLYRTLAAAFPSVEVIAGNPLLLLATDGEVMLEPSTLAERYRERSLATTAVVPSYLPIKLDGQRRAAVLERLRAVAPPLNRDFIPVCYAYAWRVWLAKFVSPAYFLGVVALALLLAALLRAAWRRRALLLQAAGPSALCALGAAGIVYETVLLLAFQALNGYVYWQLGGLFAAFMLGLAAGSGLAARFAERLDEPQAHHWLRALLAVTGGEGVLLAGLLPVFQRLPVALPWMALFGPLLFAGALLLGLAFPVAARLAPPSSVQESSGTLYAADLWGAALGAVFASALVVPLIGLTATVGTTGILLLLIAWLRPTA